MTKPIVKYVKECHNTKIHMTFTPTASTAPFIHTISPLTKTGNGDEYAVALICDLTTHLITSPVTDKNAKRRGKGNL